MMSCSAFTKRDPQLEYTSPDYVPDSWIERVFEDEEDDPELQYLKADEELDREEDFD